MCAAVALGLPVAAHAEPVPHLPEVREILTPIQVKVNAGHYQDLRLGQDLTLVRDGMVVAYATVSSVGEDWSVLDVVRQRPGTIISVGDQVRALGYEPTLPMGLRRPLVEKTEPRVAALIDQLLATDVDHGLESDPPLRMDHYWHVPVMDPGVVIPMGRGTPTRQDAPATDTMAPLAAPTHRAAEATWVFELKHLPYPQMAAAIGEMGYGSRLLVRRFESPYPEDEGKVLMEITAADTAILNAVSRLIADFDRPRPGQR